MGRTEEVGEQLNLGEGEGGGASPYAKRLREGGGGGSGRFRIAGCGRRGGYERMRGVDRGVIGAGGWELSHYKE